MQVRAIPPITVTMQIHFHPSGPNGKNPRPYPREATAPRMKNGPVKRQWTRPHREALSRHSAPMTPRDAVHKTVLQTGDAAQPRANANHGRHQKRKPLIPLHSRSRCGAPRPGLFLMLFSGLTRIRPHPCFCYHTANLRKDPKIHESSIRLSHDSRLTFKSIPPPTDLQATRLPLQEIPACCDRLGFEGFRTLFVHEWNVVGREDSRDVADHDACNAFNRLVSLIVDPCKDRQARRR